MDSNLLEFMGERGRRPSIAYGPSGPYVRGFRSRPGAPHSSRDSMFGLGIKPSAGSDPLGKSSSGAWSGFFQPQQSMASVASAVPPSPPSASASTPVPMPYGTAGNPIQFSSTERDSLAARRAASNYSPPEFKPGSAPMNFQFQHGIRPGETSPGRIAASLAENLEFARNPRAFASVAGGRPAASDYMKAAAANSENWFMRKSGPNWPIAAPTKDSPTGIGSAFVSKDGSGHSESGTSFLARKKLAREKLAREGYSLRT